VEVGIIEREEWRSVETSSGGEYVMMNGIQMTLLLCAGNWDFQKKVFLDINDYGMFNEHHNIRR
jgi:hypothetical protein